MRTRTITTLTVLALPLVFSNYGRYNSAHAQPAPGMSAVLSGDDHDRDRDRDAREMGHRDGMQAAYDDMRDRRRPDADDHRNYRHPPVDKHVRDDYRAGFRDGYNDAFHRAQAGEGFRDHDDRR